MRRGVPFSRVEEEANWWVGVGEERGDAVAVLDGRGGGGVVLEGTGGGDREDWSENLRSLGGRIGAACGC